MSSGQSMPPRFPFTPPLFRPNCTHHPLFPSAVQGPSAWVDWTFSTRTHGKKGMPTLDWIGKKEVVNHHREVPCHLLKCRGR